MRLLFSIAALLSASVSFCQQTEEKLVEALDSFSLYRPQEKAYVLTDRNTYVAGETIWFKTFTTLFEKPGMLSKVLYVSLADQSGKVVQKKMLPIKDGSAAGELDIASDLSSGNYTISAYTLWMLNFPDFIIKKKISIINTAKNTLPKKAVHANSYSISFFPEGGNIIVGVNNKIAFKAINEYGEPVQVTGSLMDNKNKNIVSINTVHDGMGTIEFTPLPNTTYKALVKTTSGKAVSTNLPLASEEGILMSADNSNPSKTFVKVLRGEKNKAAFNELLLVAQQHYKVVYMAKLNIDEGLDAVAINKRNLLPGIVQLTVMTKDGIPLAERIIFVANHSLDENILTTTISNTKRSKSTLSLDLSTFVNLDAAVAVTNAEAAGKPSVQNIFSGLLLTSDIKGDVHDPAFYFINKETATLDKLDLVMLTNGWRRYDWKSILENKYPDLRYPFETGLSITGKVKHVNGKSPLKDGKINLILRGEDSTSIMSEATLNTRSEFIVDKLNYQKNATVYYQGTNQNKQNALVNVSIDPVYYDTVKTSFFIKDEWAEQIPLTAFQNDIISQKEKDDANKARMLDEIVLKTKRLSPTDSVNKLYASAIFEHSDQTLILDQTSSYYDVWQYMQRMVPGILIDRSDGVPKVSFGRYNGLDFFSEEGQGSSVQFFLNEVPVSVDIVDGLNPLDIGVVKVYKGATGIILGAGRGAIALYTIKGNTTRDWRIKGFEFFKKSGYSVNREFYRMDYSKLNATSGFSDLRPTIYWNPKIEIKDGKAILDFYNDDVAQKFNVIIEGVDKNGKLLHIEKALQ